MDKFLISGDILFACGGNRLWMLSLREKKWKSFSGFSYSTACCCQKGYVYLANDERLGIWRLKLDFNQTKKDWECVSSETPDELYGRNGKFYDEEWNELNMN